MKNDISNSQFLDFSIISLKEPDELLQQCEGSNQKKLLVVFDENDENEERKEFLKKILAAAQFDLQKDTLLLKITPKDSFSFIAFRTKAADRFGEIDNMLVFGFPQKHFGINVNSQNYQPFHFYGCGFLFADALSELEKNKNLKAALWQGMQQLFLK